MWFFSWRQQQRRQRRPYQSRARVRHSLETLEDRTVPSTITLFDGGADSMRLVTGPANAEQPSFVAEITRGTGIQIQQQVSIGVEQMSYNLQYLQLQSALQEDNRAYTAISNIFQTLAGTIQNSIGNIR